MSHFSRVVGGSHRRFDVKRPHVLPMFLQQRDEEVDGQMDVLHQFIGGHANMADGDRQAQHLRQMHFVKNRLVVNVGLMGRWKYRKFSK